MKLRFKVQPYQSDAVASIVDCFAGQPMIGSIADRLAPGEAAQAGLFADGFGNAEIRLDERAVLANLRAVQRRQNLPVSDGLVSGAGSRFNLDVEMETGTGKTYCYIKTIFELNRRYGWSKFIVMVPSIAIREGVLKSLEITADHFVESYGRKARFFVYNSKRLHELEGFASDAGINVMVINVQAFNARGADNRRIYDELDDFQSRRPIDVIAGTRPILILDEPQKMEGPATVEALPKFRPLMILRYSATHRTQYNRVHRLDALDAYRQKLVKKIAVRGIEARGFTGSNAYVYLEGIDIAGKAPVALVEFELRLKSGQIKRQRRRLAFRDDLFALSGGLDQYRGFTISEIDYNRDLVEFSNGIVLEAGDASGDVSERDVRRIQIREAIKAHLDKERQLFPLGIKVLSLFFIDAVVKYRDYGQADEKGDYARLFEEEYERLRSEYLAGPARGDAAYRRYLAGIEAAATHNGYFSIDRKTHRLKDPAVGARAVDSDDVDAYGLILKDKERLLDFAEPTRFIFSHSALREGWDNPNVFTICLLKHGDGTISRRQEVGRGLRLAVDQRGERPDDPATVHDINVLTVVASESYGDFVRGLQQELSEAISTRGTAESPAGPMPLPAIEDGRRLKANPLNANFTRPEFRELWARIGRKAVYRVEFDTAELVGRCIAALDAQLQVTALAYSVQVGIQRDDLTDDELRAGDGFALTNRHSEEGGPVRSPIRYDLVGKVAGHVRLTRKTVAAILAGLAAPVFGQFRANPEQFIAEAARIIAEQKAAVVVERLAYDEIADRYGDDVFTAGQASRDFSRAGARLKHHVYDYVMADSEIERRFAEALDSSDAVAVYAKLPRDFLIPTPVGSYNPDWAIAFKAGSTRYDHVVAETKGAASPMHLRGIEAIKIACARKFFAAIGGPGAGDRAHYAVVRSYDELMDLVGPAAPPVQWLTKP